jgi:aspartyl-tRNA(Asn)/glutamyl-tRNA(Gln) amidotransferase subunit B
MERGQMRFEPNINLHITRDGKIHKTPIVEVKNLNSFRALEAAVSFEIERQYQEWLENPEGFSLAALGKQNRGFDVNRGETVFQREKEEAHDYRYFPEPDLVPVLISDDRRAELAATIGELPRQRQTRYSDLGLSDRNAQALTMDRQTGDLFDSAVEAGADPVKTANLLVGKGSQLANQKGGTIADLGLGADRLAEISSMLQENKISSTTASRLLETLVEDDRPPVLIAKEQGWLQETDPEAVLRWIEQALEANPKAREDVQSGGKNQKKALGFLTGQVMKISGGAAPPQEVQRLLREKLLTE